MKTKLNIWLIRIGEVIPFSSKDNKMRNFMLAEVLSKRGHKVTYFTSGFNHQEKKFVIKKQGLFFFKKNISLYILNSIGYKKNISLRRYIDHRIIANKFRAKAEKLEKPDIILCAMPAYDLTYEVVKFANKYKIPIIVDIRDQWPDLFIDYTPKRLKKILKILLSKDFANLKKTMSNSTHITAMTLPLLEWGLKNANREKTENDKIFYIGYEMSKTSKKPSSLPDLKKEKRFIVTYVGTFGRNANPSVMIEAAKELNKDCLFILAGKGELLNKLKKESKRHKNVIFPGWLNKEELSYLFKNSDVGVCPTEKSLDFLPNKAASYFSESLPVISAYSGELKSLNAKHKTGFYFSPNSKKELIECIEKLRKSSSLYKKMSSNAKKIYSKLFDPNKIYSKFSDLIEKTAKKYLQNKN